MSTDLTAEQDCVVRFHYVLHSSEGEEVESSRGGEPVAALIGHGNLMQGLEKALIGRRAGENFDTTLQPKDAYGERHEDRTQRISKKYIRHVARLKPGMATSIQSDTGPRTVTVLKIGGKFIDVDLNHPLAGQVVRLAVEVVEVREAAAEELSHGHVHGAGGHHH